MTNRTTINCLLLGALLLLAGCNKGSGPAEMVDQVADIGLAPAYTAERYMREADAGGIDKNNPAFQQYPASTSHKIVLFDGREIVIPQEMTADDLTKTRWARSNFTQEELLAIHAACKRETHRKLIFAPPSKGPYDMDTTRTDLPQPMLRFCNSAKSVATGGSRSLKN